MNQQPLKQLPPHVVLQGSLLLAALVLTIFAFASGNPALGILFALVPFGLLSISKANLMFVLVFWMAYCRIRIPGLPGKLMAVHFLIALVLVIVLVQRTILKRGYRTRGSMWFWLYGFAVVLGFTIAMRGTGFRMLGDYNWGGVRYVELFLTLSCVFIATQIQIKEKYWRVAIYGMIFFSFLPLFADIVFALTHGRIYHLYYFVHYGSGMADSFESFESGGLTRFQSARLSGPLIFMLPFLFHPFRGKYRWFYAGCMLLGLVLSGISGHRLAVLRIITFLWLYGFLISKGARFRFVATSIAAGLVLLIPLVLFADALPLSFQRALSWIPFAKVSYAASISASSTIAWRLDVWHLALQEIPRYWLLGKGYTYNYNELLAFMHMPHAGTEWARITVAYHNGPISLLVGMGVVGLVFGFGFMISASLRHHRMSTRGWQNPSLQRMHKVLFVQFVAQCIIFATLYGDVQASFPLMFMTLALLEGLRHTEASSPGSVSGAGGQGPTPIPGATRSRIITS